MGDHQFMDSRFRISNQVSTLASLFPPDIWLPHHNCNSNPTPIKLFLVETKIFLILTALGGLLIPSSRSKIRQFSVSKSMLFIKAM